MESPPTKPEKLRATPPRGRGPDLRQPREKQNLRRELDTTPTSVANRPAERTSRFSAPRRERLDARPIRQPNPLRGGSTFRRHRAHHHQDRDDRFSGSSEELPTPQSPVPSEVLQANRRSPEGNLKPSRRQPHTPLRALNETVRPHQGSGAKRSATVEHGSIRRVTSISASYRPAKAHALARHHIYFDLVTERLVRGPTAPRTLREPRAFCPPRGTWERVSKSASAEAPRQTARGLSVRPARPESPSNPPRGGGLLVHPVIPSKEVLSFRAVRGSTPRSLAFSCLSTPVLFELR